MPFFGVLISVKYLRLNLILSFSARIPYNFLRVCPVILRAS